MFILRPKKKKMHKRDYMHKRDNSPNGAILGQI